MSKYIKLEDAIEAVTSVFRVSALFSGMNDNENVWREKAEKVFAKIEVSEDNQVLYGTDHNCILTMFGECSYNETGCSDCAVAEKIREALRVEVSEDCINRAEAIDALDWIPKHKQIGLVEWSIRESDVRRMLRRLPSIVPSEEGDTE